MATSKTLAPTNVTIQIPEFTDQPDQRVNSNCIDKEADAINSLNTAIGTLSSLTTTAKTNLVSAINEVDGDVNTAVNGTLTPSTGFSSDEVIVRQFGHFVMVKGYISGSITATYAVVAQISGVTMPSSTVRTIAGVGSAAYDAKNSCYFAIGTDGKIAISPTTTGSYLVFDVVYCV